MAVETDGAVVDAGWTAGSTRRRRGSGGGRGPTPSRWSTHRWSSRTPPGCASPRRRSGAATAAGRCPPTPRTSACPVCSPVSRSSLASRRPVGRSPVAMTARRSAGAPCTSASRTSRSSACRHSGTTASGRSTSASRATSPPSSSGRCGRATPTRSCGASPPSTIRRSSSAAPGDGDAARRADPPHRPCGEAPRRPARCRAVRVDRPAWWHHGLSRCQVLGDDGRPAATVIAPCRPEQRRPTSAGARPDGPPADRGGGRSS